MQENQIDSKTIQTCGLNFSRPSETVLQITLTGSWTLGNAMPATDAVEQQIDAALHTQKIGFDSSGLTAWDTGILTFLIKIEHVCARRKLEFSKDGLPAGIVKLLKLASAVPARKDAHRAPERVPFLAQVGSGTLAVMQGAGEMLEFIGETFLSFLKLLQGRARFRRRDLALIIQECGAQSLPIVTLISILVGLILAFVGSVQLEMFGAQIYVANLVGLGMVREMGAMMTAIIMAGRTGAAFAAQLGTMQVNEEIDALKTLGISPVDFLVLPRMLGLVLMLPLLCIYADFMGILGGGIVGVGMLDLSLIQYVDQTRSAISLTDFAVGVFKSGVFGVLVALAGCLRGLQCGRSSSAVGIAATSAVVTAIVWIVVSDAIITVICNVLGV